MKKNNINAVEFSGFISKEAFDAFNVVLRADHKRAVLDGKRTAIKDTDPVQYKYADGYDEETWSKESKAVDAEKTKAFEAFRKTATYERTEVVFGDERKVNVQAFDALDIECKNGSISFTTVLPVVISWSLAGRVDTVKDKDYTKAVQVSNDIARRVNGRLGSIEHKDRAYKNTSKGVKANDTVRRGRIKNMVVVFYAELVKFYRDLAKDTKGKACHFETDGSLVLKESNIIDKSKGGITKAKK